MTDTKKFYISDLHFGHTNCLAFDNRPFKSIEHHDMELIRRWNSVVRPGDIVYILGDMFWCKATEAIEILKQLNGQKILIKGNHDRCHDINFKKCFVKICEYEEVEDGGDKIVLCHYPIPCFKNHFYGWLHFYGHVHTSFEHNMMLHNRYLFEELYTKPCAMYNIGAMLPYMNFTPRTKEEIIADGDAYFKAHITYEQVIESAKESTMNNTHGDILHSPNTTTNGPTINDLVYRTKPEDTTGGLSSSQPYNYQAPPGEMGWICPKCGRGLAPHTSYCPCYMKEPSITYRVPNFEPDDYPFGPSITCTSATNHSEN